MMIQQSILNYLKANCQGRENAKTKAEIMKAIDFKDERFFREAVHQLRLQEIPILSCSRSPYGYFIAANENEALEALRELNGRALDLHLVCKSIRKGLKQQFPDSQLPLDLPDSA